MTTLRTRNDSDDGELLVCIWHATNPLASDGDSQWLDETGAPTTDRSRVHRVAPGRALELDAGRGLALTLLPKGAGAASVLFKRLMHLFDRGVAQDDAKPGRAAPVAFSLASVNAKTALRVRVFASAAFQFSPLRELSLAPGDVVQLSTGEKGISMRVRDEE
jgi:hypothetical protein